MVHTYRHEAAFESGASRFFHSGFFILLVLTGLLFAGFSLFADHTETQFDWFSTLLFVVGLGVAVVLANRRDCREIRLRDDGVCEFETKRRITRLHVNEIRSVTRKHHRRGTEHSYSYLIRFRSGELRAYEEMTDFDDFVARLKTLNPAVELINFPADAGF